MSQGLFEERRYLALVNTFYKVFSIIPMTETDYADGRRVQCLLVRMPRPNAELHADFPGSLGPKSSTVQIAPAPAPRQVDQHRGIEHGGKLKSSNTTDLGMTRGGILAINAI